MSVSTAYHLCLTVPTHTTDRLPTYRTCSQYPCVALPCSAPSRYLSTGQLPGPNAEVASRNQLLPALKTVTVPPPSMSHLRTRYSLGN